MASSAAAIASPGFALQVGSIPAASVIPALPAVTVPAVAVVSPIAIDAAAAFLALGGTVALTAFLTQTIEEVIPPGSPVSRWQRRITYRMQNGSTGLYDTPSASFDTPQVGIEENKRRVFHEGFRFAANDNPGCRRAFYERPTFATTSDIVEILSVQKRNEIISTCNQPDIVTKTILVPADTPSSPPDLYAPTIAPPPVFPGVPDSPPVPDDSPPDFPPWWPQPFPIPVVVPDPPDPDEPDPGEPDPGEPAPPPIPDPSPPDVPDPAPPDVPDPDAPPVPDPAPPPIPDPAPPDLPDPSPPPLPDPSPPPIPDPSPPAVPGPGLPDQPDPDTTPDSPPLVIPDPFPPSIPDLDPPPVDDPLPPGVPAPPPGIPDLPEPPPLTPVEPPPVQDPSPPKVPTPFPPAVPPAVPPPENPDTPPLDPTDPSPPVDPPPDEPDTPPLVPNPPVIDPGPPLPPLDPPPVLDPPLIPTPPDAPPPLVPDPPSPPELPPVTPPETPPLVPPDAPPTLDPPPDLPPVLDPPTDPPEDPDRPPDCPPCPPCPEPEPCPPVNLQPVLNSLTKLDDLLKPLLSWDAFEAVNPLGWDCAADEQPEPGPPPPPPDRLPRIPFFPTQAPDIPPHCPVVNLNPILGRIIELKNRYQNVTRYLTELEAITVPLGECIDGVWTEEEIMINVPKILKDAISNQFERLREIQKELCEQPPAIAAIPEWWAARPGADRPQLVITFAKEIEPGKLDRTSRVVLTIPHYSGPLPVESSPVGAHTRGPVFGELTLKDNSRIRVFAEDEATAEVVIAAAVAVTNSDFLEGTTPSIKRVEKAGLYEPINVIPIRAAYYPTGQLDNETPQVFIFD